MRVVVFDRNNTRLGETNITGTRWLALDDRFSNRDPVKVEAKTCGVVPLRFEVQDDASRAISGGPMEIALEGVREGEVMSFDPGKLEIILTGVDYEYEHTI